MNPNRSLFARITINGKKTDLGFAPLNTLFIRAAQTYAGTRSNGDVTMVLEVSGAKLPDTSILNREQQIEQSLAAQIVTDANEESPFEGITIGRVQEAMASPEYELWARYCIPDNRLGLDALTVTLAHANYRAKFPDCDEHFPKWVES